MTTKFIIANWKMHGVQSDWLNWAENAVKTAKGLSGIQVVLSAPALGLSAVVDAVAGSDTVFAGAQNIHEDFEGAHTGCTTAEMGKEAGAVYTLVGHSERRDEFSEKGAQINAKVKAAHRAGLLPVLCFGEMGTERAAGDHLKTIERQLTNGLNGLTEMDVSGGKLLLAYEPVWAISTSAGSLGRQPELAELEEVYTYIRAFVVNKFGESIGSAMPLLYGGSVKSTSVIEALSVKNITGVLVGGASLDNTEFSALITNASKA